MSAAASAPNTTEYTVVVNYDPDDEIYYATIPTLGIVTQGDSQDEAFWMAEDAIAGWLQVAAKRGTPIRIESERPVEVRKVVAKR